MTVMEKIEASGILPEGPESVVRIPGIKVEMRDGVRLATDVYLPAAARPARDSSWPVILERTPYGKRGKSEGNRPPQRDDQITRAELATAFAANGYAAVVQDVRGRHGSEGTFHKYVNEAADGEDTLAWILRQPWCGGKIGTVGQSYAGHTQLAMASLGVEGLACMFIDSGGFANAHRAGARQGGAFELKQITWAFNEAKKSPEAQADPVVAKALAETDLRAWFARMPWTEGDSPLSVVPDYERYVFREWREGRFTDYWRRPGLWAEGYYRAMPRIPVFFLGSWYDPYAGAVLQNYRGLRDAGNDRVWAAMGPWIHCGRNLSFSGDVDFGSSSLFDGNIGPSYFEFRLSWFDRWLKGVDNGVDRRQPVTLFVMGGGSGGRTETGRLDHGGGWVQFPDWPPAGRPATRYYLDRTGTLLEGEAPREPDRVTFRSDPRDPVPAIGGAITSGRPVMEGGAFDQREDERFFGCHDPGRPLAARPDVLVFQTGVLDRDVVVIGPVAVKLFVSSDCPDIDVTAKLVDLYPPNADYPFGFAMNITDGIQRMRYRNGYDEAEFMTPGTVCPVTIELFPTANRFSAGHRIRLDIAGSKFPHFDINPNSGEPDGEGRAWRVATNHIHLGGETQSYLELTIVDAD